jgi:hypothetical protein
MAVNLGFHKGDGSRIRATEMEFMRKKAGYEGISESFRTLWAMK